MSRTLPNECPHGHVYDWGDFGCECGPNGSCLAPAQHRAVEHCPHGCNNHFSSPDFSVRGTQ